MSIHSLSALLAAILTFVVGWSVILRDRRHRPHVTLTVFCFNLCFWYLARFFTTSLQSERAAWMSYFLAIAIPITADRFFRAFLADDPRRPKPLARPLVLLTVTLYAVLIVGGFYGVHRSRLFTVPLLVFVFGSLYHCVFLIYLRQRAIASRPEAVRLAYLLYGGAAAVTLAITDFLPIGGRSLSASGNVVMVIYVYFLSQTLFHYRLLDIKELLGKMVTLSALVLTLTTIYGLLLVWVGGDQPGVFFFNTIVASFVILVMFDQLRTRVEDRVNRWLFKEKYAFSRRLSLLSQELANIIEVRAVVTRILTVLEQSARVTHCSIYLADPSGTNYLLAGHVGPQPVESLDALTRRLFFERLRQQRWLAVEGLERELAEHRASGAHEQVVATGNVIGAMEDLHSGVCIPLVSDDQLLGLLNLRDDRLREAYATDELEQLRRVAAEAAITLRNSQLYEQMKERDRLAALGQMAAGLAHEIRNPLGAIKGAAQLLSPPTDGTDQESAEYIGIIIEEVNRLDRVVSQFLGYARPDRGQRTELSLNEVLHRTLQLLRSEKPEGVEIEAELAPDLPTIRADAEQLRQVFLNLAINAFQAMEGGGTLRVTTRLRRGYKGGAQARFVEIGFHDDGKGIPVEEISNIFIPFFTTKEGGSGLGLPICQRIIENHMGSIELRSHVDQGSHFTVLLPTAIEGDITQPVLVDPGRRAAAGEVASPAAGGGQPAPEEATTGPGVPQPKVG